MWIEGVTYFSLTFCGEIKYEEANERFRLELPDTSMDTVISVPSVNL